MDVPKQFDNITLRVIEDLKDTLRRGSKVSMTAASFSIYAYEALQRELEQVDELRFIFTSPTFTTASQSTGNNEKSKKQKHEFYIPKLNRERTLYGSDLFDFFQMLDAVTIARSRKHIEKYYDSKDIGKFPTRLKPDAIAEMHPLRVVFRDSSFTEASQKMNLFELFKQKCQWDDAEVKNNVRVI